MLLGGRLSSKNYNRIIDNVVTRTVNVRIAFLWKILHVESQPRRQKGEGHVLLSQVYYIDRFTLQHLWERKPLQHNNENVH